jgi:hypothetical protein
MKKITPLVRYTWESIPGLHKRLKIRLSIRSDAPVDPLVKNPDDGNSLGTVTTVLNVKINVDLGDQRIPDVEPTLHYFLLVLYSSSVADP